MAINPREYGLLTGYYSRGLSPKGGRATERSPPGSRTILHFSLLANYKTMKKQAIYYFAIGIAILTVAIPASYYFLIYLPRQNENSRLFTANQRCREVGEKLYQEDVKAKEESKKLGVSIGRYSYVNDPEYTFNQGLNTCLYAGHSSQGDPTGSVSDYWVKDALTNKEILRFYILSIKDEAGSDIEKCDYCVASLEEFEKRKVELFQ